MSPRSTHVPEISSSKAMPIAIIGYSYRMPGGYESDDEVWKMMQERQVVQTSMDVRYGENFTPHEMFQGDDTKKNPFAVGSPYEGYILNGKELEFDCTLFGIGQAEAKRMDPSHKLMLTTSWEALQMAGIDHTDLHGSNTSVYIGLQGASISSWRGPFGAQPTDVSGGAANMTANRLSYYYGLTGTSLSMDTACSSAVTAMHSAIRSLQAGDCDMSLLGTTRYLGNLGESIGFNALGVISPTGSSRSFSDDANGYMRSEGTFCYVLKRLADAERDGDPIFGVVRGCDLNTAGPEPSADVLTQGRMIVAPVQAAQTRLMHQVLNQAKVNPTTVDYVEAHATGTAVGDFMEGQAIAKAYGSSERPLRVASSRSNFGHMEAASFGASLLKVVLMMKHRQFLPMSSHFTSLNSNLAKTFEENNVRVLTECEPFPEDHLVRVGINSFGFGGSNGHVVIEEYRDHRQWEIPPPIPMMLGNGVVEESSSPKKKWMVPLTAKGEEAIVENARRLLSRLPELAADVDFATLVANLCRRVTHFRQRVTFEASDYAELNEALMGFIQRAEGDKDESKKKDIAVLSDVNGKKKVVMIFPGQGSQWLGCGKELYQTEPVFRAVVDAIDAEWVRLTGGSKLSPMAFGTSTNEDDKDDLNKCINAQPVTFLVQAALFETYKEYGVQLSAVVGHSAGEVAAAYASGAYTLEEACRLVYHRAVLQEKLAGSGRMLVLQMSRDDVTLFLQSRGITFGSDGSDVHLACFNSPSNTVVCGAAEGIARLQETLIAEGLDDGKLIPGNIAFHSPLTSPIHDELLSVLASLEVEGGRHPLIPFVSTVTGTVQETFNKDYWWRNVREPVDFLLAVQNIQTHVNPDAFLEISPHITLRSPSRSIFADSGCSPAYLHSLVRGVDASEALAKSLGSCFMAGIRLAFKNIFPYPQPITHLLPSYTMKMKRTIDDTLDDKLFNGTWADMFGRNKGELLQSDHTQIMHRFAKNTLPWIKDHEIQGAVILPAAAYVSLVFHAFEDQPLVFEAKVEQPLVLSDNTMKALINDIRPLATDENEFDVTFSSKLYFDAPERSINHVQGVVKKIDSDLFYEDLRPADMPTKLSDFDQFSWKLRYKDVQELYDDLEAKVGHTYNFGPTFRMCHNVQQAQFATHKLMRSTVTMPSDRFEMFKKTGSTWHPTFLDACGHLSIVNLVDNAYIGSIPKSFKVVLLASPPSNELEVIEYVQKRADKSGQAEFKLGESEVGWLAIYDKPTGELIGFFTNRVYFNNDNYKSTYALLNHSLEWQAKGYLEEKIGRSAVESLKTGCSVNDVAKTLISSICTKPQSDGQFLLNVGEYFVASRGGEILPSVLDDHFKDLTSKTIQFTMIAEDSDLLVKWFQTYGVRSTDIGLRFAKAQEDCEEPSGILRPGMFELLIVKDTEMKQEDGDRDPVLIPESMLRMVAPGGLVLVESSSGNLELPSDWNCLYQSSNEAGKWKALVQAPTTLTHLSESANLDVRESSTRVVVDDTSGFSAKWRQIHPNVCGIPMIVSEVVEEIDEDDDDEKKSDENMSSPFADASRWERVDYFAMDNDSTKTGKFHEPAFRLAKFVNAFVAARSTGHPLKPAVFTVFTSGAMMNAKCPSQTSLWGAIRSIAAEAGDINGIDFRIVDVATSDDLKLVPSAELFRERELCVHHGTIFASRMINIPDAVKYSAIGDCLEVPYFLASDGSGMFKEIKFQTRTLPPLGDEDVEVAIKASALNFRDLMVALARLPALSYEHSSLGRCIGMEGAGEVVRIGKNVTRHSVGDRVIVSKGDCIANVVQCEERAAMPLPDNLSFQQGASVLSVYGTAYHALYNLASLNDTQSVLIHSGMGGVGQAAIALAKRVGATIYATAGNEKKRKALREMGCAGVFDSHSTQWYRDLMKATSNRGVDCVLNSLAGKHVDLCLEALAPGGCHCEIGKVDIFMDRPMRMCVFRKNIRYCAIDIDRLTKDNPERVQTDARLVLDLLRDEEVPPIPVIEFPYSKYPAALRMMMNGRHQGKIVLVPPQRDQTVQVLDNMRPFFKSGTVVLTGCMGGFGIRLFSYIVAMGATDIVFMDRDKERRRTVEWIWNESPARPEGVTVQIVYGDAGVKSDVDRVFADIAKGDMPPVKAIYHLAGVLDDKLLPEVDEASFTKVFAPKANGAWYLHEASLQCPELQHFVMLSSTSAALGNVGQVNYSAANAFQDGLAQMRRNQGLPGLSFAMAGVLEVGMASKDPRLLKMMKANGLPAIPANYALVALDFALRNQTIHPVATVAENLRMPAESTDFLRTWGQLVSNQNGFSVATGTDTMTKEGLMSMLSHKLAELCNVDDIDPYEPLASYGLNSMSVAELIMFLRNDLGFVARPMELMTNATCDKLADLILNRDTKNEADDEADPAEIGDSADPSVEDQAPSEACWVAPASALVQRSRFAIQQPIGTTTSLESPVDATGRVLTSAAGISEDVFYQDVMIAEESAKGDSQVPTFPNLQQQAADSLNP